MNAFGVVGDRDRMFVYFCHFCNNMLYNKSILMHCSNIIQVNGISHAKIEDIWSSYVTLSLELII